MFDTMLTKSRPLQISITSHWLFLLSHLSFELPSPSHVENTKNHKRQQPQSVELGRSQVGHTGVERSMFFRHARIPIEVCKRFRSTTASLVPPSTGDEQNCYEHIETTGLFAWSQNRKQTATVEPWNSDLVIGSLRELSCQNVILSFLHTLFTLIFDLF